jgi:hypothetical protein
MSDVIQGRAGGLGGAPFEGYAIPEGARLSEVHVFAERYVHAIQFVYVDADGNRGELPKVGGEGGQHHQFLLESDEYVTGISGLADWYIDQIRFHTNRRVSGSFGGDETGKTFELAAFAGQAVVGLNGWADCYIDSVSLISRPSAAEPPAPADPAREARPKDLEKVEGIGPKIAALLVANGILDLSDLAAMPAAQIKQILSTNARFAIADPTTWPEQAALGASGDWDAMAALQKKLKAGRRV